MIPPLSVGQVVWIRHGSRRPDGSYRVTKCEVQYASRGKWRLHHLVDGEATTRNRGPGHQRACWRSDGEIFTSLKAAVDRPTAEDAFAAFFATIDRGEYEENNDIHADIRAAWSAGEKFSRRKA